MGHLRLDELKACRVVAVEHVGDQHGSLGGTSLPTVPQERKGRLAESKASHMLKRSCASSISKPDDPFYGSSLCRTLLRALTKQKVAFCLCVILYVISLGDDEEPLRKMDQLLRLSLHSELR